MDYKKELEKLNEYQRKAVLDESNACIVNASVGSGKTTVLISKIIYLHHEKNVSYKDMVVLTFTNKAADEIKERLINLDTSIDINELNLFGTFHSVALYLLKNVLPKEELGYTKDFFVIEPDEELDIAMEIIQENKLKIKYKNRLKKRLEKSVQIHEEEKKISKYDDDIFSLVEFLKKEKVLQNKMSFTDIINNANLLLDNNKIKPKWIIIDEVQDSDKLQLHFIDKLKTLDTKLFAVGDPNQVIYSWRGSDLKVFDILKNKYEAKEVSLPINYRSSNTILEVARCFLRDRDSLKGIRNTESKILVKNHYDAFNEACYLADKIRRMHKEGAAYKDIAIFYRLHNQSKVLEDVFLKNEVPYEVSLKKNIRDIPVLNWLIKVLRFSVNPNDISSAVYVISNKDYGAGIREKTARKIIKEKNIDKSELLKKMNEFLSESSKIIKTEDFYAYFEFDKYIRPTSATYKEDKEYIYNLFDIIMKYINEKNVDFLDGLKEFINSSALYGLNILKEDINSNADSVKLMTLHASKGLEFSSVFIIGVNYGLVPLNTGCMEEEEEEERLFFVGVTRAKDYLELSYYTNPDYYRAREGKSLYLHMIPPELIENDVNESTKVNLQELKKQIQKEKNELKKEEVVEVIEEVVKKVRHKKYGIGKVIKEDEMMLQVEFENYGVKEFIKGFSELEFI
ncbi:ATP-dependent helicase [Clostridium felsineum]|uniref:ATP-dependent helicase n=1 Tax=Clostridium felsineum TaxID=36839 RepID=UPI00214D2DE0|nr:ATP-dependent helicase [Clostridium felsineum]MCR3761654.1 ATP-dependent helicase [Clostridium felsineum]